MSAIDIRQPHQLSHDRARALVDEIATGLKQRYQASSRWCGDCLEFSRPGIDGRIDIEADAIRVRARLGLLLAPMKSLIEREILAELSRQLDA